jgi:phenylpropionate dioxygenase-like ring-hydroxylating dioxygenase large terminal subunit
MSYQETLRNFANNKFVPEGWFWLLKSADVVKGTARSAKLLDKDFVIYRGDDNQILIMDAYCPHMGAHLCDGTVEGNAIRCPFHHWKYNASGECIDIPAQKDVSKIPKLGTYIHREFYGLIWIWTGDPLNVQEEPVIPELQGKKIDWSLGNTFTKNCHPNVVMINAIDAQHFKSVHNLVVDLNMNPTILSPNCIQLSNTTPLPTKNFFLRWASRFYKSALTYEMTYWYGNVGSVMIGPDFLHFYIFFALRPNLLGQTEGQTILLTEKRTLGFVLNPIILFLTKIVGNYFATGDTIIFSRIKFNFLTPLKADKAIIHFVEHYETQKPAHLWKNQS